MITVSTYEWSPNESLHQDTLICWALEEVGLPYQMRLVPRRATQMSAQPAQPFGCIPVYEEGSVALFETESIVLHIAERQLGLIPTDANARARSITWMFAALRCIEPAIVGLVSAKQMKLAENRSTAHLQHIEDRVRARLNQLAARLDRGAWLDERFSAGDLLMVSVLLRLKPPGLLSEFPCLAAYVARGEARPAYRRALAARTGLTFSVSTGLVRCGSGVQLHPVPRGEWLNSTQMGG